MSAHPPVESGVSTLMATGTLVGGRFLIEREATSDALGTTFVARDQKTQKPVGIYVLSAALGSDPAAVEVFREEARLAAKLKHRSLAAIYGVGTHAGQQHFVAREWVAGKTLGELVLERRAQSEPLSVRGVYNVVAHVCKALAATHELSCHGSLRPTNVWVSKSGRVKVSDLGTGLALVKTRNWTLLTPEDQAFLAPEIKAGGVPSPRSDIFGVGALLYVLLTGRSPIDAFVPPSQVHPEATPELDAVLLRCLSLDPAQRCATPDEITQALLPLAAGAPESKGPEFGADVEIDVDIAISIAPPAPAHSSGAPAVVLTNTTPSPLPAPARAPTPGPAASPAMAPRAPVPPQGAARAPQAASLPMPLAAASAPVRGSQPEADAADIAELTARLTKNDAPRWMAVKNGMDHGPFTARELIKLIVDGEVLEQHELFNMATSERKKVSEYPEFTAFVQQYKIRREEQETAAAIARSSKVEKRGAAAKFVVLASSLGVLLIAGVSYLMSRQAASETQSQADRDLAALYESGQVKISGTAGILQHTPRPAGARKSASGGGPGPGGFSSYEDAMNQAMELGDATKGGGEKQLSSAEVAGVMNRNLNSMFSCVSEELRRGGRLDEVRIDLAILGSGRVAGASVSTGSPAFQRCITGKLQSIAFPSFPAPRMGARYRFNVN